MEGHALIVDVPSVSVKGSTEQTGVVATIWT
jgi:hypothetical protein